MQVNSFLQRIFHQLPLLFPLVALFHFVLLGYTVFVFAQQGVLNTFTGIGSCMEMLLYTILWIAICDRRRWAAIAYLALAAVNLMLLFLTPQHNAWRHVSDALFPFDVLMSFFLLFFYRRFR